VILFGVPFDNLVDILFVIFRFLDQELEEFQHVLFALVFDVRLVYVLQNAEKVVFGNLRG
jgi:hypothetical protein